MIQWLMAHHKLIDWGTQTIATCSVLHSILPPWDWNPDFVKLGLREFPTSQKLFYALFNNRWYRVFVYIIGFAAINMRSTVWHFISVSNAEGPNANTPASIIETITSEKVVIPVEKPTLPSGGGS